MKNSPTISEEDIKHYGVFAPIARYLDKLLVSLEDLNGTLRDIEDRIQDINHGLRKSSCDEVCEHQ